MLEVVHDELEALVFLADEVLDGNFDILDVEDSRGQFLRRPRPRKARKQTYFESDESGTSAVLPRHRHSLAGDSFDFRNEQERDPFHLARLSRSSNGRREVVRVDSVRDPFLCTAVRDYVVSYSGLKERRGMSHLTM